MRAARLARWAAAALLALPAAALGSPLALADRPPLLVPIASGWFVRGSATGDADERPPQRLWLDAFAIDRVEVTRGRYASCVRSGPCRPPQVYDGPQGESLPVVGVSWDDASAYCAWRGARLPTEAEWERAARGPTRRVYPWGDALRCDRANFGNFAGDGLCAGTNPGHVVTVGSYPSGASPEGVLDLAGNVWEWVADAYGPYDRRAVRNPRGPADPRHGADAAAGVGRQARVARGGSCCSYFSLPRTSNRLRFPPDYVDVDLGFRCAR